MAVAIWSINSGTGIIAIGPALLVCEKPGGVLRRHRQSNLTDCE